MIHVTQSSLSKNRRLGGFAAGLAIVPYYNKPSQEGMYQHFKAIADASDLPILSITFQGV